MSIVQQLPFVSWSPTAFPCNCLALGLYLLVGNPQHWIAESINKALSADVFIVSSAKLLVRLYAFAMSMWLIICGGTKFSILRVPLRVLESFV